MLSKVTLFDTCAQAHNLIKQRGIFLCSSVCYVHLFISVVKKSDALFIRFIKN
jgi:hypothetical protein